MCRFLKKWAAPLLVVVAFAMWIPHAWSSLSPGQATVIAAVAAIIAALITLSWNRRGQDMIREDTRLTELRSRYTAAAEQLGSEASAVRLAGVYAMAALADDWLLRRDTAQAQICVDVLTAYLGTQTMFPMPDLDDPDEGTPGTAEAAAKARHENRVRRAIVDVLTDHRDDTWKKLRYNLTRAYLVDADLSGANLSRADLTGAYLERTRMIKTNLEGAILTGARFRDARVSQVKWEDATLNGAYLKGMHLAREQMSGVRLVRANLSGANLSGADLMLADLTGAHLGRANLLDAATFETALRGADLTQARVREGGLDSADTDGATGLEKINWEPKEASTVEVPSTAASEAEE